MPPFSSRTQRASNSEFPTMCSRTSAPSSHCSWASCGISNALHRPWSVERGSEVEYTESGIADTGDGTYILSAKREEGKKASNKNASRDDLCISNRSTRMRAGRLDNTTKKPRGLAMHPETSKGYETTVSEEEEEQHKKNVLTDKVCVLARLHRERCVRRLRMSMQRPHPMAALRNTIRADVACMPRPAAALCARTAGRRCYPMFRGGAGGVGEEEGELCGVGVLVRRGWGAASASGAWGLALPLALLGPSTSPRASMGRR
ncbi:hypothetical protein B0H13DRAFT_2267947 [Mycena leptocephala]|nr:hypothetical protein B0H13DRAFT_2267947 [Mycena leptocephala]